MLLIVSASARPSPFDSTVRRWRRSPFATAVTTFTMPRTWFVRLFAIVLTLSVRSFHVPCDARHLRLAAELAFGARLRARRASLRRRSR
jgi:hypothetical protein